MSIYQSNLEQYGYDMVVATTQAAINATIKQFLSNYDGKEFVSCFVWDSKEKKDVPGNYDELTAVAGMDIFSIPDTDKQNQQQREAVDRLYDKDFSFGFRATMGLPEGFPNYLIPDVVVLDQGNIQVTYNLFFKNFIILNTEEHHHEYLWTNMVQECVDETSIPWIFKFTVKLDLSTAADSVFSNLPGEVQKRVKNLNPDSAFSVEQLYLDLNTAGLDFSPSVVGLNPSSDAAIFLNTVFIQSYFQYLKTEGASPTNPDGNFLLGYAIKPVTPSKTSPSIIPTDLNFVVTPYYDDMHNITKDYSMYTLNYLVMSNNNRMPATTPMGWNWIQAEQKRDAHGAMSIKKGIFTQFLDNVLSPSLKDICLIPTCNVNVKRATVEWTWGFKKDPDPILYNIVNDGTSHAMTLNYFKSVSSKDNSLLAWGNMRIDVSIQSDIYFEGNIIRSVTTATVFVHINIDGGVTAGNFVKYKTETSYEINVDQDGNLRAKMAPGSPLFTDLSDKISANGWSKFVTLGEINGLVDDVKKYWSVMQTFLTGHDKAIESMLNGSGIWVFPGGKTFLFKDVTFSNFQDLVALITYVEPQ